MDLVLHIKETFLSIPFPMAMKWLSFWRGQSVSSPAPDAQLGQTQTVSAPAAPLWLWAGNRRNTPLHLCPRELISLGEWRQVWIWKEKQSFTVSNACALFCRNMGKRVASGGDGASAGTARAAATSQCWGPHGGLSSVSREGVVGRWWTPQDQIY